MKKQSLLEFVQKHSREDLRPKPYQLRMLKLLESEKPVKIIPRWNR